MDITTPEEILKKHLDIIPTRLTETTEAYVLAAMREYGELKQSPRPFVVKIESARHLCDILMRLEKKHHSFLEIAAELLESYRLVPVSETPKQSPRWVKASERLPEEHKNIVCKFGPNRFMAALINGYFRSNDVSYSPLYIEWLDESGSPEPGAVENEEFDFTPPDKIIGRIVGKFIPEAKDVASDTDVLKRTKELIKEVKRLPSYGEMWNLQSAVEQLESVLTPKQ